MQGVPKDPEQAFAFAQRACTGGAAGACARVERARIAGDGVAKDVKGGLAQLDGMCARRDASACESLVKLYGTGMGSDVPADPLRVRDYAKKACDLGSPLGCQLTHFAGIVDKGESSGTPGTYSSCWSRPVRLTYRVPVTPIRNPYPERHPMKPKNGMRPIHPGEILREEFLKPLNMSATKLAETLDLVPNRITTVVSGERDMTPDTALRLGKAFDMSPEFWLNLQQTYDLRVAEDKANLGGVKRITRHAGHKVAK